MQDETAGSPLGLIQLNLAHARLAISTKYSLAVRLPATVVEALSLKESDEIEIHIDGDRGFVINKSPEARELLARLKKYRGRLPADFKFDRLDASENS